MSSIESESQGGIFRARVVLDTMKAEIQHAMFARLDDMREEIKTLLSEEIETYDLKAEIRTTMREVFPRVLRDTLKRATENVFRYDGPGKLIEELMREAIQSTLDEKKGEG